MTVDATMLVTGTGIVTANVVAFLQWIDPSSQGFASKIGSQTRRRSHRLRLVRKAAQGSTELQQTRICQSHTRICQHQWAIPLHHNPPGGCNPVRAVVSFAHMAHGGYAMVRQVAARLLRSPARIELLSSARGLGRPRHPGQCIGLLAG